MTDHQLGDRVKFTGTVRKADMGWPREVRYEDAPPPGFVGYQWANGNDVTHHPRTEGIIVGKRRYTSMENDEGLWIPDGVQVFDAYLVAWHMRRNPVIVREDQIVTPEPRAELDHAEIVATLVTHRGFSFESAHESAKILVDVGFHRHGPALMEAAT